MLRGTLWGRGQNNSPMKTLSVCSTSLNNLFRECSEHDGLLDLKTALTGPHLQVHTLFILIRDHRVTHLRLRCMMLLYSYVMGSHDEYTGLPIF